LLHAIFVDGFAHGFVNHKVTFRLRIVEDVAPEADRVLPAVLLPEAVVDPGRLGAIPRDRLPLLVRGAERDVHHVEGVADADLALTEPFLGDRVELIECAGALPRARIERAAAGE